MIIYYVHIITYTYSICLENIYVNIFIHLYHNILYYISIYLLYKRSIFN